MSKLVWIIISISIAVVCLVISVLQFKEKGFLFNNAYILASKEEREKLDKKKHYRQSSIVFALCSLLFFCIALENIFLKKWLMLSIYLVSFALLLYAIISSIKNR